MALVKSINGNSVFRTEDISYVCKLKNKETGRDTKMLAIGFKSGREIQFYCKTIKESNEVFYIITEAMQADYKNKHL